MRVIAFRVLLVACAMAVIGAAANAAPLLWLSAAWAFVGSAALVAALVGVAP
ncbi:MAG: hypothetical protein O9331_14395 [Acidovorax sp.]|nr:hypothetical protein [Acidovorax sp.]